ncbi:hypothetical protein ACN47E_005308 [Coniothyrium glycines]
MQKRLDTHENERTKLQHKLWLLTPVPLNSSTTHLSLSLILACVKFISKPEYVTINRTMIPYILFILAACTSYVHAANTVIFTNNCPWPAYWWTVGPQGRYDAQGKTYPGEDSDRNVIPGFGASTVHTMLDTESLGGGVSLKIRDMPRYRQGGAGIMQLEYHLEASTNSIWYDLSKINCAHHVGSENPAFCPLVDGGIKVWLADSEGKPRSECPTPFCTGGECFKTYGKHGFWLGEPSFMCAYGSDIHMTLCAEREGPHTFASDPASWEVDAPAEPVNPVLPSPDRLPQGPLSSSPNGLCGYQEDGHYTGWTCSGTHWGECCSQWGYCGATPEYCGSNAQHHFGNSTEPPSPSPSDEVSSTTEDLITSTPTPTSASNDDEGASSTVFLSEVTTTESLTSTAPISGETSIPLDSQQVSTVTATTIVTETITAGTTYTEYITVPTTTVYDLQTTTIVLPTTLHDIITETVTIRRISSTGKSKPKTRTRTRHHRPTTYSIPPRPTQWARRKRSAQ